MSLTYVTLYPENDKKFAKFLVKPGNGKKSEKTESIACVLLLIFLKNLEQPNVATGSILQKKGVLKSFAVFIEKHLCWSLFLTKLQWLLLN